MKTYRAILIDDEQKGLENLAILIKLHIPQIAIVAETTKPREAINLVETYRPEIVFLDINMPELNGFEVLENLSWKNFHLIFTTAHQEHAIRALRNNAFDYLLKPIDIDELKETVERLGSKDTGTTADFNLNFAALLDSLGVQPKQKVVISTKSEIEAIDASEIICLESKSNYTILYLSNGQSKTTARTLKEYEAELCGTNGGFMRVHHSYIVNLEKIARFIKGEGEIVMQNGQKIPLATSRKEKFTEWLEL